MPQHPITVVGNLTQDPTLTHLKSGAYTTEIRIAASRSVRDEEQASGWRDIDHLFITGKLWGQLAQNTKASLRKGMPVIATGRIVTEEWEEVDRLDGMRTPRQRIVLKVERLGLDMSKYVVSSRRTDTIEHRVDGLDVPSLPDGQELTDRSYASTDSAVPSQEPELATVGSGAPEGEAADPGAGEGGGKAPF